MSSVEVRPVAGAGRATRAGRYAGRDRRRASNTPPTCSTAAPSRRWRAARSAAGGGGGGARPRRSVASTFSARDERRTILHGWNDTAHAVPSGHVAGAVRRAGRPHPRRHRGGVRGADPELRRARCARQSAGASPARSRCRTRDRGRALRRAFARDAGRPPRHPQGGRRLSAARSRLPARAPGLHARGCPRAGAASRTRRCSIGCPRTAPRAVCLDADWPDDRAPARTAPDSRARSATPRLRHLHLGLHRYAQGRLRTHRSIVELHPTDPMRRGPRADAILRSLRSPSMRRPSRFGDRCSTVPRWC